MIEKATHVTIFWNLARNPEKNSSKIRRKKCKIRIFAIELMKFINSIAKNNLAIFDEKIEIRERCKGVHCVDLGESFPTSIYLQKSASIQPRTSPPKFSQKALPRAATAAARPTASSSYRRTSGRALRSEVNNSHQQIVNFFHKIQNFR